MSTIHASCGTCPKQLLVVSLELTMSKSFFSGFPSPKFACACGTGTPKTGTERRAAGDEMLTDIAGSYNVRHSTISRL
jgi:hypothetical protein